MPNTHSHLSPSASQRWLTCPGSLRLPDMECSNCGHPLHSNDATNEGHVLCPQCNAEVIIVDDSSEYAKEGTAAHSLVERCLMLGTQPADHAGEVIDGFEMDQAMIDGAELFLSVVDEQAKTLNNPTIIPELQISHPFIVGLGGTADCIIFDNTTLIVVDYKYGAGHPVEVEENTQLKCYACLALRNFSHLPIEKVKMIIVQPRAAHADGPVRLVEMAAADVLQFETHIQERVQMDHLESGNHCRWCPCKVQCPELQRVTLEMARDEFSAENGMTPELAAEIIGKKQAIDHYMEATYKWALGRAKKGEKVPGYKLVNALANRAWALEEKDVVKHIQSRRRSTPKSKMYQQKLLSPAQMEKALGKRGPEIIKDIVNRAPKGATLVPESDSRQEIEGVSAEQEFADVQLDELLK